MRRSGSRRSGTTGSALSSTLASPTGTSYRPSLPAEIRRTGIVQEIARAIDRYLPGVSSQAIAIATNDVYHYLHNPGIRDAVETGVREGLATERPTVVVAHSLGSIVAYNVLRRDGSAERWDVPQLVTLGSPLGVGAIRKRLRPLSYPNCVDSWFNAYDTRDFVSLFPLDGSHFPVDPPIVNRIVGNPTDNHHGIVGYLDNDHVARTIHAALT